MLPFFRVIDKDYSACCLFILNIIFCALYTIWVISVLDTLPPGTFLIVSFTLREVLSLHLLYLVSWRGKFAVLVLSILKDLFYIAFLMESVEYFLIITNN